MPKHQKNVSYYIYAGFLSFLLLVSMNSAHAEDFCNTAMIMSGKDIPKDILNADNNNVTAVYVEKKVREKCKIGDVIVVSNSIVVVSVLTAKLCDFNKSMQEYACILAPPRKEY